MDLLISPEEFNDRGILAVGVDPVRKYNEDLDVEDRKHREDSKGRRLWDVECTVKHPPSRSMKIKVRLADTTEPEITPGLIRFGGLATDPYMDGDRLIVRFVADTFTQDSAPSAKRNGAKAEPPVPAGAK